MPFIATPRQFSQRAELYRQLAQIVSAGIGLVPALEQVKRNPPAPAFREPIQRLIDELAKGHTFTEAMHSFAWLPVFDMALLQAGEQSGRLDACFRLLADHYNDRARIVRQMMADMAYPVFVFHFAVLVVAFLEFVWNGHWLLVLAGGFIPVYALTVAFIYAAQNKHGETWRAFMESVLTPVPVLGTALRYLALSRLAAALEALISAGVTIVEAWELAAKASGSPALRHAVEAWKPQVVAGQTPAEAVRACPLFPEMFANLYSSGEISGKLDDSLRQLHRLYDEDGTRKLHAVTQWVPRFVYFVVAIIVACIVIRFWMNYFGQISSITDGS
jgi:type IV pilus assembly protein PilC